MAQFVLHVGTPTLRSAADALTAFKVAPHNTALAGAWWELTVADQFREPQPDFSNDTVSARWAVSTGTWFHPDAPSGTAADVLRLLRTRDVETFARELEGFFAIAVGDEATRTVRVVTDVCGSCHVFSASSGDDVFISTSSAALAATIDAQLDPVGLHEFIATGVIYGEHTLWRGVTKLPPASICTVNGRTLQHSRYWGFGELNPERLRLPDAVQAVGSALTQAAVRVGRRFARPVCDVTGGYDSRACLTGFLSAGVNVEATVSGPQESADVRVSKIIAQRLGLRHIYSAERSKPSIDDLIAAVRLTDGECDAFDYARVRQTHLRLLTDHDVSINGSFGELGRGYWWELLFPNLRSRTPLDVDRIVAARFAAVPYDASIFAPAARLNLREQLRDVAARAVAPLSEFPKTTQLDCLYFTLRMQRWQGRIASSTHQLWPCLSPFAFRSVLTPILEAQARARIGSRLVRHMISQLQPELAEIPLEHGYPAQPVRASNVHRFAPLIHHFGERALKKGGRVLASRFSPRRTASPLGVDVKRPESPVAGGEQDLVAYLTTPLVAETGLFEENRLTQIFDPADWVARSSSLQWRRLVTVELLLRELVRMRERKASGAMVTPGL